MKRVFIYGLFNDSVSQIISSGILQKLIDNNTFKTEVSMNYISSFTSYRMVNKHFAIIKISQLIVYRDIRFWF